jgi:hypothetical protein
VAGDAGLGWLGVLLSALVGAATAVLAGIPLEHYKRHRDRRGTAAVIAGEIAALLHVTERGNTIENFRTIQKALEAGKDVPIPEVYTVEPTYGPIFEKLIDKLGLLPVDVAERVVQFYGYLIGIRAVLKNLFSGAWDEMPDPKRTKAGQIAVGLALWADASAVARPLIDELRTIAAEPWPH